MKNTRTEYLDFFTKWIHYQFPRASERIRNILIIGEVKKIVYDDDEAAYWGDRDCWTMYDIASKQLNARAIVAVE